MEDVARGAEVPVAEDRGASPALDVSDSEVIDGVRVCACARVRGDGCAAAVDAEAQPEVIDGARGDVRGCAVTGARLQWTR
jgi:hypothetical protein